MVNKMEKLDAGGFFSHSSPSASSRSPQESPCGLFLFKEGCIALYT